MDYIDTVDRIAKAKGNRIEIMTALLDFQNHITAAVMTTAAQMFGGDDEKIA